MKTYLIEVQTTVSDRWQTLGKFRAQSAINAIAQVVAGRSKRALPGLIGIVATECKS